MSYHFLISIKCSDYKHTLLYPALQHMFSLILLEPLNKSFPETEKGGGRRGRWREREGEREKEGSVMGIEEMTQQGKCLLPSDDLNSIPTTHMVEGETQLPQVAL